MDTVTHALFGLATYGALDKNDADKNTKAALLTAAVVGSQIPDIDFVTQFTETGNVMYQMWHRGLSHSIFMAPIWALVIYGLCYRIWRRRDKRIYFLALINTVLHIGFDSFNAWGTGILEPFSSMRLSLGIIPIVDFVIWLILLIGFLITKYKRTWPRPTVWKAVWCAIALHVLIQGAGGYVVHQQAVAQYDEVALSAAFVPWHFSVIGKTGNTVELSNTTFWGEPEVVTTLKSQEDADLHPLFTHNPKAEVLKQWSPFVVIVKDEERLGIYDPRFYRKGSSFLFEYVYKSQLENSH